MFGAIGGAVIGDGGDCDEDVGVVDIGFDSGEHLRGAIHIDPVYRVRCREVRRAGDERDLRARIGAGLRERIAHFSAGMIGDDAHWVDGFLRGTSGDQNAFAGEQFGLRPSIERGDDFGGLEHAAIADFAARLVAVAGADDVNAVGFKRGDISLRGGVLPHLQVHGGRDDERDGARQDGGGEQIITATMHEPREKISGRGCDEHDVVAAREFDVRHAVVGSGVPQIAKHRVAGQRLKRCGAHEFARGSGHGNGDFATGFDQKAREFGGFICGDAAGDAEQDAARGFDGEFHMKSVAGTQFAFAQPVSPSSFTA